MPEPSRDRRYQEICTDIRATDEISFELMGLVPLLSGAVMALSFKDKVNAPASLVVALSLFGAVITLALFRWELRNIQRCNWLLRRREAMEEQAANEDRQQTAPTDPANQPISNSLGRDWQQIKAPDGFGKTQAVRAIYLATTLTWLLLPAVLSSLHHVSWLMCLFYVTIGLPTAVVALCSVKKSVEVEPVHSTNAGINASGGDATALHDGAQNELCDKFWLWLDRKVRKVLR